MHNYELTYSDGNKEPIIAHRHYLMDGFIHFVDGANNQIHTIRENLVSQIKLIG